MAGFSGQARPRIPSAAGAGRDEEFGEERAVSGSWLAVSSKDHCPRTVNCSLLLLLGDLRQHLIDQAELLGVLGGEVAVALRLLLDLLDGAAGVVGEDLVEALAVLEDLVGLDFDVGHLAADLAP